MNFRRIKYSFRAFDSTELLMFFYIPVNMLSGFLIQNGQFNYLIGYKIIVIIMVLGNVLKKHISFLYVWLIPLVYVILHLIILGGSSDALIPLMFIVKFLSIIIYSFYFTYKIKRGRENFIFKFVAFSFVCLFLNQVLGVMGFGEAAYLAVGNYSIGTKGFFFSINETSLLMIAITSILLMKLVVSRELLKFIGIAMMGLFMAASLTNKTAFAGIALMLVFFPVLLISYIPKKISIKKVDMHFISYTSLLIPLMILAGGVVILYYFNLFEKISYFSQSLDTTGLLMSGRDLRLFNVLHEFEKSSLLELLFGLPDGIRNQLTAEIDPIDVLAKFGLTGLFMVYGIFLILILKVCSLVKKRGPYSLYVLFFLLLLFSVSLTAGHVVFSGVAGPFIAVVIAYAFYKRRGNEKYSWNT